MVKLKANEVQIVLATRIFSERSHTYKVTLREIFVSIKSTALITGKHVFIQPLSHE